MKKYIVMNLCYDYGISLPKSYIELSSKKTFDTIEIAKEYLIKVTQDEFEDFKDMGFSIEINENTSVICDNVDSIITYREIFEIEI